MKPSGSVLAKGLGLSGESNVLCMFTQRPASCGHREGCLFVILQPQQWASAGSDPEVPRQQAEAGRRQAAPRPPQGRSPACDVLEGLTCPCALGA